MRYKHYLSFGFNCEVGFALQHVGVFEPMLFSWADVRGTTSLVAAIRNTDGLLTGRVKPYSSNMFFCQEHRVGFHGKVLFSDAVNDQGDVDNDLIASSLEETRNRIQYLAKKQLDAIVGGNCLIVVKYFADVFDERYSAKESMSVLRTVINEVYGTDDFDLLYVAEGVTGMTWDHGRDFYRLLPKFSPRSNAGAIDKNTWENLLREFLETDSDTAHSVPNFTTRWWNIPKITQHINRLICGDNEADGLEGLSRKLRNARPGPCAVETAISIHCGNGSKELQLLRDGVVNFFTLYDERPEKLVEGQELALSWGMQDKVCFKLGDPSASGSVGTYDLVFWHSTLQNVRNVYDALAWSRSVLNADGQVLVYGYIGPSRFQWDAAQLDAANRALDLLPQRFRAWAHLAGPVTRPPPPNNVNNPNEAADSGRIIDVAHQLFRDVEVIHTGGVVYHIALGKSIGSMRETQIGEMLMGPLLLCDELLARNGVSIFGVVTARN